MTETPDQMADRWAKEVSAHAVAHVERQIDDVAILDKHLRREVMEMGITAGYAATIELLVREGLLPTMGELR